MILFRENKYLNWNTRCFCRLTLLLFVWGISKANANPAATITKNNPDMEISKSYDSILRELRNNWQSPISYLKKRGYIPKMSDAVVFGEELVLPKQQDEDCSDKSDDQNTAYEYDKILPARENVVDKMAYMPYQPGDIELSEQTFLQNMRDKIMGLFKSTTDKVQVQAKELTDTAKAQQQNLQKSDANKASKPSKEVKNNKKTYYKNGEMGYYVLEGDLNNLEETESAFDKDFARILDQNREADNEAPNREKPGPVTVQKRYHYGIQL